MKDPSKLQSKLQTLLKSHPNLRVSVGVTASKEGLREVAWVIKDYVENSGDVTNDDPLYEWLEEYHFFSQESP